MKVEFLVNQAKKYLPLLTDMFSDKIYIQKVEVIDGLFTVTTKEDLKLEKDTEAVFFIQNIPLRIDIEKIEKIKSDEAFLYSKQNHNQTKDPSKKDKVFINIQGCEDNLYNVKTEVLEDYQDAGFKLRIKVNQNTTDNPNVENAFFYIYNYFKGNGIKRVKILDKNKFSFQEDDTKLNFIIEDKDDMYITFNTRIFPAYDFLDAKAQFSRNIQNGLIEDKITKENKPIINIKKSNQITCFIVLDDEVNNTASNFTSVGYYNYKFHVYTFFMHRNINKYILRDFQDFLLHKVFNKIFGEKNIFLTDKNLLIDKTEKIKFIKSSFAENRENDLSVIDFQYEFRIQTFIDDYKLPILDVRLNNIEMDITNRDSDNFSKIELDC